MANRAAVFGLTLLAGGALAACQQDASPTDSSETVGNTSQPIWSDSWKDLGFAMTGGPGAAPWSGLNLTLFWRTSTNHIFHSWQPEGYVWQPVEDIGTNAASDPSGASDDGSRLDVVWRSSTSHLMHRVYNGGWGSVEDLGAGMPNAPKVVIWPGSFMSVFWRGSNNHLMHRWYDFGTLTWSSNQDFGYSLTSDPGVMFSGFNASGGAGSIDVFWRGTNGHVKHAFMPYAGQWVTSPEEDIGGNVFSGTGPTAAMRQSGQSYDTFWRGGDSHLHHRFFDTNTGWAPEDVVDPGNAPLASSPVAMSWGYGRIDVFAKIGSDVQHRVWNRTMNVPLVGQIQSEWCWATSAQMISTYWGREVDECLSASHATGLNCCATPLPNGCNVPGLGDYAWMGFAFDTTFDTGHSVTLDQAYNEMASYRPWDHGIIWLDGNGNPDGGHDVVGIDLFWFDDDWWVVINDPLPQGQGSSYVQRYSEYYNGTPGVSLGDWDILNIRPQ